MRRAVLGGKKNGKPNRFIRKVSAWGKGGRGGKANAKKPGGHSGNAEVSKNRFGWGTVEKGPKMCPMPIAELTN